MGELAHRIVEETSSAQEWYSGHHGSWQRLSDVLTLHLTISSSPVCSSGEETWQGLEMWI